MSLSAIESPAASPTAANVPAGITKRQVALPLLIFAVGFSIYGACILGAVLATDLSAKIGFAILGGVVIANLAIIGHDACPRCIPIPVGSITTITSIIATRRRSASTTPTPR